MTSSDAYQVGMEVSGAQRKNAVIFNMLYEIHQAITKVRRNVVLTIYLSAMLV